MKKAHLQPLPVLLLSGLLGVVCTAKADLREMLAEQYPVSERMDEATPVTATSIASAPRLGAAHAISLSSDIPVEPDDTDATQPTLHGPWLSASGLSANAQQLIRALQNAPVHGLNPEAYGLPQILRTVDQLASWDRTIANTLPDNKAQTLRDHAALRTNLTRQLDAAFLAFTEHMGRGVVDASAIQLDLHRNAPRVFPQALLKRLKAGKLSVSRTLHSITPERPAYHRLTQQMRDLLTEQATGVPRTRVSTGNDLTQAQWEADIMRVKMRLIETGELPEHTVLTNVWSRDEKRALMDFQQRHGLKRSGIPDSPTRAALNMSIEEEITAIAMSLERWRWMPRNLGERHIFINIPDFTVQVYEGDQSLLSMKTIVGAQEHPTPVFSRDMSYMDFNPVWTVPASITNRELIPLEKQNPGYLQRRDFEFLQRRGNTLAVVPFENIPPKEFTRSPFPYILRQRSGPDNQLGRMKFMMPNPYAIYLHDTQAKRHFILNDRAFSHGCIRLSEPDALAQLLMEKDGYPQSAIENAFNSTTLKRISFRSPIPTHLAYLTSWVDDNGILQHRPDIYHHNGALRVALWLNNTLLSTMGDEPRLSAAREVSLPDG